MTIAHSSEEKITSQPPSTSQRPTNARLSSDELAVLEKMGEDTLEGVKLSGGLTPEQARDKVSELTADGSPYWNARHPEHDWYVQEAMKFREILNV